MAVRSRNAVDQRRDLRRETRLWSFDPQPDGTLKGLTVGTILSNGCGTQGTVYRTPFVARRTGDVAPSVVVADPALFTTAH